MPRRTGRYALCYARAGWWLWSVAALSRASLQKGGAVGIAKLSYQQREDQVLVEVRAAGMTVYGYGPSRYAAENDLRRELQRLSTPGTPFVNDSTRHTAQELLSGFERRRTDA